MAAPVLQLSQSCVQCYVFVDDSNLWIGGKEAVAKKLKDTDTDPRYRVDLGRFLDQIVTDNRLIAKAFLYGSKPPPNDTVWRAAREKNFKTEIFQRSGNGREKEVDVAMGHQITKTLYRDLTAANKENVVFITVTGDRDLKLPIQDTLDNGVPVELWSWKHCMAQDYWQLAKKEALFTANCLDDIQENFSYTAFMSTREKTNINQSHAIVYEDVPKGEDFLNMVAAHMTRLLRLFYITSIEKKDTQDLIVEFPKTKQEVALTQLRRLGNFDYEPCSYYDYKHSQQQGYKI